MREDSRGKKDIIVVDLDGTLLDDQALWIEAADQLKSCGVSQKEFLAAREKEKMYRKSRGDSYRHYSLDDHIAILAEGVGMSFKGALRMKRTILNFLYDTSKEFLFPDAGNFILSYHKQVRLILLTKGIEGLQRAKIDSLRNSYLGECFDSMIITQENKGEALEEICRKNNESNVVFIDNSAPQVNSVSKSSPGTITFWLKRPAREDSCHAEKRGVSCDYMVKSLKQADRILAEII